MIPGLVGDTDTAVVGDAHGVGGMGVDELVLPNLSRQATWLGLKAGKTDREETVVDQKWQRKSPVDESPISTFITEDFQCLVGNLHIFWTTPKLS